MAAKFSFVLVFLALYAKAEPMDSSAGRYNFTKLGSRWPGSYSSSYKFVTEPPHSRSGKPDFMKLSIWWPASFCNSNKLKDARLRCDVPIRNRFLLHEFRPMYGLYNTSTKEFYDDTVVPPYRTKQGCSTSDIPPASVQAVNSQDLSSIWDEMAYYWPSLVYGIDNVSNWKNVWEEHGMCAEELNASPLEYFRTAIDFIENYKFLRILQQEASVAPDDRAIYNLHVISDAIKKVVGVRPQLRCSLRGIGESRVIQFIEIIFCFYWEGPAKGNVLMNCENIFVECPRDIVKFPTIPIT